MSAFGFSIGDFITVAAVIRKIVTGLKSSIGAAAQYQRTAIELENWERLLRKVEGLVAYSKDEKASLVDTLRATALATTLTLQGFLPKLQKYENRLALLATRDRLGRGLRSTQWVLSMDEEVEKIRLFVSAQLLNINTLLQLLERENAQRRESRRTAQYQDVMSRLDEHTITLSDVQQNLLPLARASNTTRRTLSILAQNSTQHTQMLVDLQRVIIQTPSVNSADCITLADALGRIFQLPYAYFSQWQLFESFLMQTFSNTNIPGSRQVQENRFVISRDGSENKAITKSNWLSNVYPGVNLSMTAVITMLKIQLGRCPRPKCEASVLEAELKEFVQCPKCDLIFRYNPDLKLLGMATEDERLRLTQTDEDFDRYGRRHAPADIEEIAPDDDEAERERKEAFEANVPIFTALPDVQAPSKINAKPTVQMLSLGNLAKLDLLLSRPTNPPEALVDSQYPSYAPALSPIDRNSANSGMSAWLNSSAMPIYTPPSLAIEDAFYVESQRFQQELKDMADLKRVHFIASVPETRPLKHVVKDFESLPVNEQVHTRRILDKSPLMPVYLVKRLAASNVKREAKLKERRIAGLL